MRAYIYYGGHSLGSIETDLTHKQANDIMQFIVNYLVRPQDKSNTDIVVRCIGHGFP
jgi:hypothetical protein